MEIALYQIRSLNESSPQKVGDPKLLADLNGSKVLDFPVTWHSGCFVRITVHEYRVLCAFAQQFTSVIFQMPDKNCSFHASETASGSWITLCPA